MEILVIEGLHQIALVLGDNAEGEADKRLLVLRVLGVGLGQVDQAPLAGVPLITVEEHVGTPNHHPTFLPHLLRKDVHIYQNV